MDDSNAFEPHSLNAPFSQRGDVLAEELGVDIHSGLSDRQAEERLRQNGPNELEAERTVPWWRLFVSQFSSIIVWLLLAAMVVAWLTNGRAEAAAIFIVLVINAVLGFAVEWRAGKALKALKNQTVTHARVRRNGREAVLNSAELVLGDIINVASGDRVPADARLLEAANLQTDESALTGESLPVEKSIESVSFSSILSERRSMLHMGTTIVAGRGLAIVTATGTQTEIGHVGQLITKTHAEKTPLERRLESLGKTLVYLVLAIGVAVFVVGLVRGDNPALIFEVSVSLAVAAVPEALPAMTTLILALGVLKMAQRNAIVRKLSAVETLGSTTVICADKTGTLTENRMSVQEYLLSDGQINIPRDSDQKNEGLRRLIKVSVLCNDASIDTQSSDGRAIGDPTETALIAGASSLQVSAVAERARFIKLQEQPFNPISKRMIVVLQEKDDGYHLAAMKGAPAVVLGMCTEFAGADQRPSLLDSGLRDQFLSINEEMASKGLRILAFADKRMASTSDNIDGGFTFLGFAGMSDQSRSGVADAIRAAQGAGIRTVMLTGDQVMTAKAIAQALNLSPDRDIVVMHASEIAGAHHKFLADAAKRANVFARVSPEDKLRIVEALQKTGEIVAVTGDGINDAPALKRADIGIAMGMRGAEVAKEAADIVLTDDNFATIVTAIEGGRTIYANIRKFVHLLFSKNLSQVLLIFVAMMLGLPLPLLPLQILWMNLVTDMLPALALAVEPPSETVMNERPRHRDETLLQRDFLLLIGWQGILLTAITLSAYVWALGSYGEGSHSRTVALLALISSEVGHTFNCRSKTHSAFHGFFRNPYIFGAAFIMGLLQLAAFSLPSLAKVLDLVDPNRNDLLVTVVCAIAPIFVVEVVKFFSSKKGRPPVLRA